MISCLHFLGETPTAAGYSCRSVPPNDQEELPASLQLVHLYAKGACLRDYLGIIEPRWTDDIFGSCELDFADIFLSSSLSDVRVQ
jgi:hypothetical protein